MLSLLLVEDDEELCAKIRRYVDELDDVFLSKITNSSEKALEHVKSALPDAVILDLELHRGAGNGLRFLQELNGAALPYRPYILVATNNTSSVTYEYARKLGADFIMSKHQTDFSQKAVVDFLRMMKDAIQSRNDGTHQSLRTSETPTQMEKRLARLLSAELDRIGIRPKHIGRAYLSDAIIMILQKQESSVCAALGRKYGKTDVSVERAMQNAINKAWHTADIDDLAKYYTAKISSEKGVPTLTEFIYYYVNKLKNEL
jgi:DNA-binding NarL/FixJ family response regulator